MKPYKYLFKWIGLSAYPFFMLFGVFTIQGQTPSYNAFLSLDFQETRSILNSTVHKSYYEIYLDNLNDCAELILNENQEKFDDFEERYEERLDLIKEFPEGPEKGFVAAEVRLQWAFIAGKYGNNWNAFWTLRRALIMIDDNIEEYPEFKLNYRTAGLLSIILDLVPSNRKWLLDFFGMKGDFDNGYKQLSDTTNLQGTWITESKIILALIDAYILEAPSDLPQLAEQPLYAYLNGLIAIKEHKAENAITYFSKLNNGISLKPYLMAEAHFINGDYDKALLHYQEFLEQAAINNYKKDALLKAGLASWFSVDLSSAEPYFEKAKEVEEDNTEIDRNAASMLKSIEEQKVEMVKLRYALDGGAFGTATQIISELEKSELTGYQDFELGYRKARLYQLSGESHKAKPLFAEVIKVGNEYEENYYVPNSYLQLARIYIDESNTEKGKEYLRKVLEFGDHPYKTSLDLKARVALNKLALQDD